MSRIAGIFAAEGSAARERLERIHQALAHPGNDSEGLHVAGPLGLSYHHLASSSPAPPQPHPFSWHDVWIVADARLDNREELCRALPGKLNGASDAELIAAAYAHWGPACLSRLEGDFAFALWDPARQRLFCARDPIGIRPFFYRWDGHRFLWASEVKALVADPDYTPAPDEAMLAEYVLGWRYFPDASATFYRGIRQLPGGHFLTIERGRLQVQRYWDIDPADEVCYRRRVEDNVAEFRSLLDRAVRRRLRATGPVGILVSGGLDSTSIACLALEAGRTNGLPPLYFLNYYFPAPYGDEREYVRTFEQKYGSQVESLGPDSFRVFDGLDEVARESETPLIEPTWSLTQQWVTRGRTHNLRALLSGFGGDNIFPSAYASCLDTFRRQSWWAGARTLHRVARYQNTRPGPLWGQVFRALLSPRFKIVAKRLLRREISPWVRKDFARRSGLLERVRQPLSRRGFSSPSQELTYLDFSSGGLAGPINYWDKLAAANHFEGRHPFLDPALVRFTLLVPWEQHTDGGEIKILLREAMRGILPEPIRQRRGKGTPHYFLTRWIREQEAEKLERLANQELVMACYIEVKGFQEVVATFLRGATDSMQCLWRLVSLEFWLRNNFGGVGAF